MPSKTCPRCGSQFLCQPENPTQCQCAGIELGDIARVYLAERYPKQCLCAKCLKEMKELKSETGM